MMDTEQIKSYISEIAAEMELIRGYQNEPIELTMEQENQIKKHPKSKRDDIRKKFIEEMEEHRRSRVMLLIMAIEDKLKSSNLPEGMKDRLAHVLDMIKNTQVTVTTEVDREIEDIKKEVNKTKETQEREESDGIVKGMAATVTAAALVATGTLALATATKEPQTPVVQPEIQPEATITTVAGVPVLSKVADPIVAQKVERAGEKALKKIEKEFERINIREPLRLEDISRFKGPSEMEKRLAKAKFVKDNPALEKDLVVQETTTTEKAVNHAGLKMKQEKAEKALSTTKKKLTELKQAQAQAKTPEEKEVLRVQVEEQNKKVEEATKKVTETTNARKKYAASVSNSVGAVIDQAKLEELSKQKKETRTRINHIKEGLKVAKNEEEIRELKEKLADAQTLFRQIGNDIKACYTQQQYTPREQHGVKQIKQFREHFGKAVTAQEILDGVPNPAKAVCREVLQKDHPEFFQNQMAEEAHKAEIAKTRAQRKLLEKKKVAEVMEEKGKVTSADMKRIRNELDEQFNPTLKQYLAHHQMPPQQQTAILVAQLANQRGAA